MIVSQLDPNNTRQHIGEFFAYHNLVKYLCGKHYGGIKHVPVDLQNTLAKLKIIRDRLAHDLWEIIHSTIISLNEGPPIWRITHIELVEYVESLLAVIRKINAANFRIS